MLDKVLIANRGEIALRVLRACRELGIKTVATHSTADSNLQHVLLADETVCIGPPPSAESYLNMPAIIAAAEVTDAVAIHPGYGFLSENADFAERVEESGFVFIGPRPEHIAEMGDKVMARAAMQAAGVPVVPGSPGAITQLADARAVDAARIAARTLLITGGALAVIMLAVSWGEDALRWRPLRRRLRASGKLPQREDLPLPRGALLRLGAVSALLFGLTLLFTRWGGVLLVGGVMLAAPLVLLVWVFMQQTNSESGARLTGTLHRLGEVTAFGLPSFVREAVSLGAAGFIGTVAAALVPARYPVDQQTCRLNPPVGPSRSTISPAKNRFVTFLERMLRISISLRETPPDVMMARRNPSQPVTSSSISLNNFSSRCRSTRVTEWHFLPGSIPTSLTKTGIMSRGKGCRGRCRNPGCCALPVPVAGACRTVPWQPPV